MTGNLRNDAGSEDQGWNFSFKKNSPNNAKSQPESELQIDLLGYALGSLDDGDVEKINRLISNRPDLEDELQLLRMSIASIRDLDAELPMPVGVARRTCEYVAGFRSSNEPAFKQPTFSPVPRLEYSSHSISRIDLIALAACIAVMAAVLIPALQANRFYARVITCQNNLREAGMALLKYSDEHGSRFVPIPQSGPLAVAGIYAPQLIERQLVEQDHIFFCAERSTLAAEVRSIPSFQQIEQADEDSLLKLQQLMGGDFGYSLGFFLNGRYTSPRKVGNPNHVVLADAPSFDAPGRASQNHGGYGQNCFFEDGRVSLVRESAISGDAIYENFLGQIAPGTHKFDTVIAPSHTPVFSFANGGFSQDVLMEYAAE
ncbi:MAG TPA: hypothetical protein PKD64_17665 [Pirellulaceae bacterium]|nr:hypothetical protein [Pirellulaceae bacterium]HMO94016.1 hypothetical protein [Pirellulaceae bacterium]HMP70777.1 hypothetical protein [Pirellulaceae bacterium]